MATEFSGGQRQIHEVGSFEVHYTANTPKRGRHERIRRFTVYSKAQAFYEKIDDCAAIWDRTNYAELCDSKTKVAYFTATIQTIKFPLAIHSVKLKASDEEDVKFIITHRLKRQGWKLDKDSIKEISEIDYSSLPAENELNNIIEEIFPSKKA